MKKTWTREIDVRIKKTTICIIISVLVVAVTDVVLIHDIPFKTKVTQAKQESNLPYGNYLPDSKNPLIRVVLKTNGFKGIAHPEIQISAANGLVVKKEEMLKEVNPEEVLCLKPDDVLFQNGSIWIESKTKDDRIVLNSLSRGCGTPSYRGCLELFSTAEGIVIVNEVALEEYLYAVVPSEMPASYGIEALKCQAICARSYAYCQMLAFAYPEYKAHVDDSVSFQVYGNSKEQASTCQAVEETKGEKLWYRDNVVKTYYYSTSCGHSTSVEAWGSALSEKNQYLKGVPICNEEGKNYEEHLPWYKWQATIPQLTMEYLIELNSGEEIGTLQNVIVKKQGIGGVALQLEVQGSSKTISVETENKIRKVLGGDGYQIEKNDGSVINSNTLLPSAFFSIAKIGENYIIKGGGYGHGIGMSQNGANEMAKDGKTYKEILMFFYPGTKVEL